MRYGQERRRKYGTALAGALGARKMRQVDLADALHTSQSAISSWITGKSEPLGSTVFATEHVLGLTPGTLSHILGYLPREAAGQPAPLRFEEFVIATHELQPETKRVVLAVYRAMTVT